MSIDKKWRVRRSAQREPRGVGAAPGHWRNLGALIARLGRGGERRAVGVRPCGSDPMAGPHRLSCRASPCVPGPTADVSHNEDHSVVPWGQTRRV
jgi:hypothetical protein